MKNVLVSALVSLLVATVAGGAVDLKPQARPSQPSPADVNAAQAKQIAALRNDVALLKKNLTRMAVVLNSHADDIDGLSACQPSVWYVNFNDDGTLTQTVATDPFAVALDVAPDNCDAQEGVTFGSLTPLP